MRKYIVVLVGLVFWIGSFGQEMPKIIPPSPEAASLFKFSEIPVSLYTGLPNIDIPNTSCRNRITRWFRMDFKCWWNDFKAG
jgi:hypothetical protein